MYIIYIYIHMYIYIWPFLILWYTFFSLHNMYIFHYISLYFNIIQGTKTTHLLNIYICIQHFHYQASEQRLLQRAERHRAPPSSLRPVPHHVPRLDANSSCRGPAALSGHWPGACSNRGPQVLHKRVISMDHIIYIYIYSIVQDRMHTSRKISAFECAFMEWWKIWKQNFTILTLAGLCGCFFFRGTQARDSGLFTSWAIPWGDCDWMITDDPHGPSNPSSDQACCGHLVVFHQWSYTKIDVDMAYYGENPMDQ